MTTLGADPEALDRLAALIGRTVVRIGQSERDISRQLASAGWRGTDAERLRIEWRSQGTGALSRMQTVLRECAATLRSQALAQREASAAHGSAGEAAYAKVERDSETMTYTAEGVLPGRILNLKTAGTLAGTISQDGLGYVLTVRQSVGPSVTTGSGKGGKGGGKSTAKSTATAASGGEIGVSGELEKISSYRFDTREEAEKAWGEYLDAVVPTKAEAMTGFLTSGPFNVGRGTVEVVKDAYRDGEESLEKYNDQKESHVVRVSGHAFSEIDFGTGILDLKGGAETGSGFEIDKMNDETTVFVRGAVDAGAALGLAGGANAEVEAGITVDGDGDPQALKLSGSLDLHAGLEGAFGIDPSSLELGATSLQSGELPITSVESGVNANFDAELDLTNAENRRHALEYLRATAAGNSAAAAEHLSALLDRTAVTVTTADTVTTGTGFDAVVASASKETSRSTTRNVLIRMPGEPWQHYQP